MTDTILTFSDFSFCYTSQTENTLNNINLEIKRGEKILIIGPSGSGKSTLGHTINAMIPNAIQGQASGNLEVNGKNPFQDGIFSLSTTVGTVLQDPDAQFVALTVGEDIAFALENDEQEQAYIKAEVWKAANIVGMQDFLQHEPHNLSGGQKQRVALAGVMSQDVEILLFDEPLANLDPATGKYAIELIDAIHARTNKTVIIIEHRLEDVLHRPIDKIAVIDEGRILAFDTPDNILSGNLLKQIGIREPLYISALKYAGCQIQSESKPNSLASIKLDNYAEQLRQWDRSLNLNPRQVHGEALLAFDNVSFAYNQKDDVFSNINFVINAGEMVSIIGKNGAGKSTISKLICGFINPTAGKIIYKGQDIAPLTIKQRAEKIALVMQNPNQMISQTMIYDEVALGLRARGMNEAEVKAKVLATLKICGLYPYRNWPIAALSYGQKKRVTIAAMLVLDPQIIILDEPTAGQDFRHYTEIMNFLENLNRQYNITVIIITHDMHLMLEYTERSIVLADGKILADTDAKTVLTDSELIAKANLKLTSLFELAVKAKLQDPYQFVANFIDYDREVRR